MINLVHLGLVGLDHVLNNFRCPVQIRVLSIVDNLRCSTIPKWSCWQYLTILSAFLLCRAAIFSLFVKVCNIDRLSRCDTFTCPLLDWRVIYDWSVFITQVVRSCWRLLQIWDDHCHLVLNVDLRIDLRVEFRALFFIVALRCGHRLALLSQVTMRRHLWTYSLLWAVWTLLKDLKKVLCFLEWRYVGANLCKLGHLIIVVASSCALRIELVFNSCEHCSDVFIMHLLALHLTETASRDALQEEFYKMELVSDFSSLDLPLINHKAHEVKEFVDFGVEDGWILSDVRD